MKNVDVFGGGKNLVLVTTGHWSSIVYGDEVQAQSHDPAVYWSGAGNGQFVFVSGNFDSFGTAM